LVRDVIEQFKPKLLHVETVKCTRWLTENYLPGLVISNKSRLDIGLSVLFPVSTVFILVNDKALMDVSMGEINSIDTI